MREVTKADGSKAILMDDEPKKRPGAAKEIITTHNISEVQARRKAEAKIEADKKAVSNAKR